MKHDTGTSNRRQALETTKSFCRVRKYHELREFGPQTAENTNRLKILHSTSLPSFAHGGQQTELNQTLPDDRK